MERNFRERVKAYLVYCLKNATAHGFIHIVRRNTIFEKFLWIIFIGLACVPCVLLGAQAWDHFWKHPTVIMLERDHRNWDMPFPSITLCPKTFNPTAIEATIEKLNISEENSEDFNDFLDVLFHGNFRDFSRLAMYKDKFGYIDPVDYVGLNEELSVLGDTTYQEYYTEPRELEKHMTEHGFCFTYNSKITGYNTKEYWTNQTLKSFELDIISPSMELPLFKINNVECAVMISEMQAWTPNELRRLTVQQRHCRFFDESDLSFSPVYSYKLCKIECRINLAVKFCSCLPFFYRNSHGEKICDIDGMLCLARHAEMLIELIDNKGLNICKCTSNCNEDVIFIHAAEVQPFVFSSGIEVNTIFKAPVRYRKSIVFSETDLLVQIGGITGLCFGLSILSALEFFYFITFRLYWGVLRAY